MVERFVDKERGNGQRSTSSMLAKKAKQMFFLKQDFAKDHMNNK
jgi:hypothetical protein